MLRSYIVARLEVGLSPLLSHKVSINCLSLDSNFQSLYLDLALLHAFRLSLTHHRATSKAPVQRPDVARQLRITIARHISADTHCSLPVSNALG